MNENGAATSVAEEKSDSNATAPKGILSDKVASPRGYKKTKVGVIPEEWEALPARNYFEKSIEKGYSGLEIYSVTLNKSWQKRSELEREIGSDVDIDKSLLAREGYLVYNTMRMWQGALGLAESTGVVSPAYIVLKPKEMIDPKFAFYQLKSYRYLHYLKSYSYGLTSDRLRLYFNDFGTIPFICPPLKEQQKIAQILTTWDTAISKQEALITAKEQLKKGLMQKLLSGEVRFGAATSVAEDNATEVASPEWEEVRLGDVAEIIMGQSPSSKSYNENEEGMPLIQGNADCKNRKTAPRIYTTEKTKVCKIGDIIMTVRAPVGAISKAYHNACIGRGVCAIRTKDDNGFLYYYLLKYEEKWEKYSQGSTFTAVNSNDIKSLKIKLPPLKEQQKIAQLLTTADKEIALLKEELTVLKEQKRGLMQRLLTGEVRVRV